MKSLLIFLSFLALFLLSPLLFANSLIIVEPPTDILPHATTDDTAGVYIAKIIAYAISLTAVLSILAITWGAIRMVLAAGEDEKVKKARMMIIYAFVGLAVSGLAYTIVEAITKLNF